MTETARRGTRISHIGIAVRALDESLPLYREVLKLTEVPLEDTDGAAIRGLAAGDSLVELLEGKIEGSPVSRFVAKRGPGIHHICFSVDDLEATMQRCLEHGVKLIDKEPRIGAEGKRVAFIHPSSSGGVLIELSEY